jgi:uncharacterized protein
MRLGRFSVAANAAINNSYAVSFHKSINEIDASNWNEIAGKAYPFIRHEFLLALETSDCTTALSGWQPYPLYLKTNSTGEYVFDWSWADAYRQHGQQYYPKFVTAIPFTPCAGSRICIKSGIDPEDIVERLCSAIISEAQALKVSSWHCLFPEATLSEQLQHHKIQQRLGCQFQWFNDEYKDFDEFLQSFSSRKRKNIKKERKNIRNAGIEFDLIEGPQIKNEHWQKFYQYYQSTYFVRGRQPYLNAAFFVRLGEVMPGQLLMTMARKNGEYIAGALFFKGCDTLYGRYWGCSEEYQFLHFETCYYQGIDYCIGQGLNRFDSGAQGEHKIQRGFKPVKTFSNHWIANLQFENAISHFLKEEEKYINDYIERASEYLPFKKG